LKKEVGEGGRENETVMGNKGKPKERRSNVSVRKHGRRKGAGEQRSRGSKQ
jgi:hypothetical protein